MSFKFQHDESTHHALKRIAYHQLDAAIRALSGRAGHGDRAIHEARKRLKRLRALLRLFRGSLKSKDFHRENRAFRDAGRPLSAARDAAVLIEAFDQLLRHFKSSARAFAPIRRMLLDQCRSVRQSTPRTGISILLRNLRAAGKRIERCKISAEGWSSIHEGLHSAYRSGRRAMIKAARKPSVKALHEWRKRVKDLRHHAELLAEVWPQEMKDLADAAHTLGTTLGDDHDLAVLRDRLTDAPTDLLSLIDARRVELQQNAVDLGQRIYSEKPRAFARRVHHYWQAWHQPPIPARPVPLERPGR